MPVPAQQKQNFLSWSEFKSRLQEELYENHNPKDTTFIFRGQGSDEWPLEPSFSRAFRYAPLAQSKGLRDNLHDYFTEEMKLSGATFESTLCANWPLGQHHGLPTPLLDWTLSPYVAAFFAAESALRWMLANLKPGDKPDKKLGITALRQSGQDTRIIWESMGVKFVSDWSPQNERIRSQRGVLTEVPSMYSSLNDCVRSYNSHHTLSVWLLKTFALPFTEVVTTLRDLEAMDINFRRLYGGIEGICRSATLKTQIEYFEDHVLLKLK